MQQVQANINNNHNQSNSTRANKRRRGRPRKRSSNVNLKSSAISQTRSPLKSFKSNIRISDKEEIDKEEKEMGSNTYYI